ncbi:hypothetical protein [Argonema antarcticum]|uniref:hypothetical protein n=1 Tax=Argonema antarcticum TaxID=2942763 RepID=UPI002011EE5D|nr:hypothetical protein [Argonema antarcticum]MCL1475276.1 hypothetical protein [Argonema antarcticum A004/B2]
MKQNNQQRATANKIKKLIQATKEVEKTRFAIPITRLTSIKSLCVDEVAAEKFALYIAQRVLLQINQAACPEHFSGEEWTHQPGGETTSCKTLTSCGFYSLLSKKNRSDILK